MFVSLEVEVGIVASIAVSVVVGVSVCSASLSRCAVVLSSVFSWVVGVLLTFPLVVGAGELSQIIVPASVWAGLLLDVLSEFSPVTVGTEVGILPWVLISAAVGAHVRPVLRL